MSPFKPQISSQSLFLAQNHLITLVNSSPREETLQVAFDFNFNLDLAIDWLEAETSNNFSNFPLIQIVPETQIDFAQGAYFEETNTIYLAQEFILEENFGDRVTEGDEGYLFTGLTKDRVFSSAKIARIPAKSDSRQTTIDDRPISIAQANPGNNPAFDTIGLTQLRNDPDFAGIDGSGFSVAIIDTGLDTTHPLLAPNYVAGFDFVDNDPDPADPDGHGTHVAGTIGATDESIGVAPDVGLIGLRVLDENGGGSLLEVENALEWVFDNRGQYNITAVNLSLGTGFFTSEAGLSQSIISDDIQRLENAGITVVGAAGNNYFTNSETLNRENLAFPAISSTIAVGAVWQDGTQENITWQSGSIDRSTGTDRIASFSQRLDSPNVVFAPGAFITSTVPGGGVTAFGGTSQASPHVAGTVALLQEASLQFNGRLLTPEEVREILVSTGDTIIDGDDEDDNVTNTQDTYVRINVYNAVSEVKRRSDDFAPTPENNPDNLIAGDSNGTIAGAINAPTLDGEPVAPIFNTIGRDGENVRNNDVDIYRFQVASPGTVSIEVAADPNNPENFDSYIRLFDPNGNEIANNDDIDLNGGNLFSRLDVDLNPGTYYVGISGYNNINYDPNVPSSGIDGDTGNYSLQFGLNNADPNGLISGASDVNVGSDLDPLVFPGIIGTDYGQPVGVSDVDLFRIVAPDNGVLSIDIDTPFPEDFVDSYVRLFDSEGNEITTPNNSPVASDNDLATDNSGTAIEFNDPNNSAIVLSNPEQTELVSGSFDDNDNYTPGNYGHNTDSFINTRVERGKIYYVGVSDFSNQNYDVNNFNNRPETGAGGQYELITTFVNDDLDGSITQASEVTPLPIVDRLANIGVDGDRVVGDRDVDFYKINSGAAGILDISVTSNEEDPVNTVAIIFDSQGQRLGVSDRPDTADSLLRYQVAPNTDYYVAVTGFGNQNFNPFALGSGSGGDTGTYTISGNLIPLAEASNLTDNTIDSSGVKNLTSGESIFANLGNDSGFIVGDRDIDIYRFIPNADATVNIRTTVNEEFSADTYLRVFDGSGKEIAANDNASDADRGSLIQLEVTAGTEYYIGVNGNSPEGRQYDPVTGENTAPGSQGNYNLSISSGNDLVTGAVVYRFFNPSLGVHFYTASNAERDGIIANLPNYVYEGESYLAAAETADPLTGARPVYRFFNQSTGAHLYTMSEAERDAISDNLTNYNYEGIAYYGYESDRPGATPLYRFYNPIIDAHFYTPSATERDSILANLPDYQLEGNDGIAFYVEPI